MSPQMKAAFIVGVPGSDPTKDRSKITGELVELTSVYVNDRNQAVEVAQQLADEGCELIELCSSFGHSAAGKIADAVRGKAAVGVCRFDLTPAFFGKSADEVF